MIIQIKFNEDRVMLFGDSYKTWQEQLKEYCYLHKTFDWEDAWISKQKWIEKGGLKWCSKEDFPKLLQERENREYKNISFDLVYDDKLIDEINTIIRFYLDKPKDLQVMENCVICGSDNIYAECHDCGVFWCEKCASEEGYECTECPPGDLIRLKK